MAKFINQTTKDWYKAQPQIIPDFLKAAKAAGYQVDDDHKTVIFNQPNKKFRIFISRKSHVVQFYYLYCGWDCKEYSLSDCKSVDHIFQLADEARATLSSTYRCSVYNTNQRNGDFSDTMRIFEEDI
jgi:hypothetical protein